MPKKVIVETYQDDKYYPRVVRAVQSILAKGDVVTAIDVLPALREGSVTE